MRGGAPAMPTMTELLAREAVRAHLAFLLFLAGAALAVWLAQPLLLPLLGALVLYAVLDPVVSALRRVGLGQPTAVLLVLLGMVGLLVLAAVALVPALAAQIGQLQDRLPGMLTALEQRLGDWESWLRGRLGLAIDAESGLQGALEALRTWGGAALGGVTGIVAQLASFLVLTPILSFFLLRDGRRIRNGALGLLPNGRFEAGWLIYGRVARQLKGYVRGVFMQSLTMALVTGVGFALLGLDLAVLLGVLAGLLNVIPYVGPLLAMIPPLLIAASGPEPTVWLLAASVGVVVIGQIVDNLVVVPAVIAQAADLHPLTVIVGVVLAGDLFGFLGMVLAIPALFTIKIVYLGLTRGAARGAGAEGRRYNAAL